MHPLWMLIASCLVLNEVLHNPQGPESGAGSAGDCREFVELYNTCDTAVSLQHLTLQDNVERDTLLPWQDTTLHGLHPGAILGATTLAPGAFAVVLDPEYATSLCAANPLLPLAPGTVVLRPGDTDLGNGLSSTDTLGLYRGTQLLDRFPGGWLTGDGHSMERWNPYAGGGDPGNWHENPVGSTPGGPNRTTRPLDLGVSAREGTGDTLWMLVWNGGYLDAQDAVVRWTRTGAGEDSLRIPPLLPGDTFQIPLIVSIQSVLQKIHGVGALPGDTVPENDTLDLYRAGTLQGLRITEVLPNGSVEWVELWNHTPETLRIRSGVLEDAAGTRGLLPDTVLLPGAYVVLTGDTGAFRAQYGDLSVWQVEGFPVLNNQRETLRLFLSGVIQDSVAYRADHLPAERSLERWSAAVDAFDPASWTPSQAPSGSTPAAPNSVEQGEPVQEVSLWVSRKVFRPERERLRIRYALPLSGPVLLSLRIYDDRGRLVRRLRENTVTGARGEVLWDGTGEGGQRLLPGLYVVWLEGRAGGRQVRVKQTVALWHR